MRGENVQQRHHRLRPPRLGHLSLRGLLGRFVARYGKISTLGPQLLAEVVCGESMGMGFGDGGGGGVGDGGGDDASDGVSDILYRW